MVAKQAQPVVCLLTFGDLVFELFDWVVVR